MSKYANKVVSQAMAWLGYNESDGTHKKIIDVYNAHKPLARNYKVKYTDAWCATFVSAVSIQLGYSDIIPPECGCGQMLELFKKLGCWVEDESRVPNPGDIIFYDWQDSGTGDDKGWPDHVGIVEKVSGNTITVIEGNYSNSVKRRTLKVNAKNLRGYGVPKYDEEPVAETAKPVKEKTYTLTMRQLSKGSKGDDVKALQQLLIVNGYNCGGSGADGSFGGKTQAALIRYQTDHDLEPDGVAGPATMGRLLGVK